MISSLYFIALLSSTMAWGGVGLWSNEDGRSVTAGGSEDRCTCDAFLPSSPFPMEDLVVVEQTAVEIQRQLQLEMGKMEIFETEVKEYAEKIKNLTVKVEKMEKNTDDYNAADMDGVKVEIKQVEALIKELQLSIGGSTTVFQSLRAQISVTIETLNSLEEKYDSSAILEMRREYIKLQLQLDECERRHQEIFYPTIGSCAHTGVMKISKPFISHINAHLSTSSKYGAWGKDSKPTPDRESMYWYIWDSGSHFYDIRFYSNYENLIFGKHFLDYDLKSSYYGRGNNAIFRDNTLYYQMNSPFGLGKLNFTTMEYESRVIPGASSSYSYATSSYQNFDFAADETGLYVTYGTGATNGLIAIAKIDEASFGVEAEWQTSIYKPGVNNVFMVCGVMYAVRNTDLRNEEIFYMFDTKTKQESYISIPFERVLDKYHYLDYNPIDQRLYMFNDGYYVSYRLWFNQTTNANANSNLNLY